MEIIFFFTIIIIKIMVYNKSLLRMCFQAHLKLTVMLNAAVYKYSLLVMAATLEIKIRSIQ